MSLIKALLFMAIAQRLRHVGAVFHLVGFEDAAIVRFSHSLTTFLDAAWFGRSGIFHRWQRQ
jgi:hypothetical protein